MKYDPYKAFPYPVLDTPNNDDYIHRDFQASISLDAYNENDKQVLLTVNFKMLSEDAILNCIAQKQAEYAIHVLCAKTNFRYLYHSSEKEFTHLFEEGDLHDKVTVMPCVICTDTVKKYHSDNFHPEFKKALYDMVPGNVLAIAEPVDFYVDATPPKPLGTVFKLEQNNKIHKGEFQFDYVGDYISIYMNEADYIPFNAARQNQHIRNFLIMSVYYPVLVEVLRIMSAGDSSHEEYKWHRSIQSKLDERDLVLAKESDCYLYAQRLMNLPLQKLHLVEDNHND